VSDATTPTRAAGGGRAAAGLALGLAGALVLLVGVRAVGLGGEYYDAYEVRAGARAVLAGAGPYPVYRSPLLGWVALAGEAVGPTAGWLAPALASAAAYAGLVGAVVALARRLGARPWVAATAGLLVALDRLAWASGPHGMPDVPAAAACGLVLALAARRAPAGGRWPVGVIGLGAAVGLAALTRQNAGLVGLALLAGLPRRPARDDGLLAVPLVRVALAGLAAVVVYAAAATALFALGRGSLTEGLAAHADLAEFHSAQFAQNRARYGGHAPWGFTLRTLAASAPALAALAPAGAVVAWRSGRPAARAAAGWAALHLVFCGFAVGHQEARYLLPATPALAALAALTLEAGARRLEPRAPAWAPAALVLALAAATLALGAPYEARRALDPVTRGSFPARLAAAARDAAGPGGRFLYTTTHPYPVAPAVIVEPGPPYPGDPFHGVYHLGPVVLTYHLGRPVALAPPAQVGAGVTDPDALRRLVRTSEGFAPGDVLLVGVAERTATWDLRRRPPPPFGVGRVVAGAGGLDVDLTWIPQRDGGER